MGTDSADFSCMALSFLPFPLIYVRSYTHLSQILNIGFIPFIIFH